MTTLIPGLQIRSVLTVTLLALTWGNLSLPASAKTESGGPGLPVSRFEYVTTYQVSGQVAEIVAATPDGRTLVYTDSEAQEVGFVDISNPAQPAELGIVEVGGEPTSVAITPDGAYALVTVANDANHLVVIDLISPASPPSILPLGGQPDAVAISPDGRYAAVVIENERDEDVDEGLMPQLPGGFLTIIDLVGTPDLWTSRDVSLTGLADRFPEDPEPEFVHINQANLAAVTLQENNWIVLVDLASGAIVNDFPAGTTTHAADLTNDGEVDFSELLVDARREPDAIGWTPKGNLVTANEGDYDLDLAGGGHVGGRSFTIFSPAGEIVFDSGAELERAVAAAGLYNDSRSDDSGVEPEGIEIARYLNHTYLFVGMERASSVAVYRLTGNESAPKFVQILETGARPEGLLAIPNRALFVTANEGDGTLTIFAGRP